MVAGLKSPKKQSVALKHQKVQKSARIQSVVSQLRLSRFPLPHKQCVVNTRVSYTLNPKPCEILDKDAGYVGHVLGGPPTQEQ